MGTQLPLKRGTAPFLAHVYCDQTAGWMKMPLGTEVDLGPGHIVLDGTQLPPRKGYRSPPLFGLCRSWPRSSISAAAELLFNIRENALLSIGHIAEIFAVKFYRVQIFEFSRCRRSYRTAGI